MEYINSLTDLKRQQDHPYRIAEYLTDGTQVFEVSEDDDINLCLIESYEEENELMYLVNWEDSELYTEDGIKIEAAYNN